MVRCHGFEQFGRPAATRLNERWSSGPGSACSPAQQHALVAELSVAAPYVDTVRECFEAVPETVANPVLDDGRNVELSVMLLLDGTDEAAARTPRSSRMRSAT